MRTQSFMSRSRHVTSWRPHPFRRRKTSVLERLESFVTRRPRRHTGAKIAAGVAAMSTLAIGAIALGRARA